MGRTRKEFERIFVLLERYQSYQQAATKINFEKLSFTTKFYIYNFLSIKYE